MTDKSAVIESLRADIEAVMLQGKTEGSHGDPESTSDMRDAGLAPICDDARRTTMQSCGCSARSSNESGASRAFKKIIALVNASDKSEAAIRSRLNREGFCDSDIEKAVSRAVEYGFIDDARYADILIRSRVSQSKGSVGIARELADNGIDADSVPGWPDDYQISHDEELERAIELLNRKPPSSKNVREGAYRRLVQKGFPSSVCSSAARIWVHNKTQGDRY